MGRPYILIYFFMRRLNTHLETQHNIAIIMGNVRGGYIEIRGFVCK